MYDSSAEQKRDPLDVAVHALMVSLFLAGRGGRDV